MLKVIVLLLSLFVFLNASDYIRANVAAEQALKNLDCEFDDCPKEAPKPEVIIKEKIVVKEVPVVVEKVVIEEKIVYKERPVVVPTKSSRSLNPLLLNLPEENFTASTYWNNLHTLTGLHNTTMYVSGFR